MAALLGIPTLFLFDRFDERIGIVRPLGSLTHSEVRCGSDVLEFECERADAPSKGDRIVWNCGERWREHIVVSSVDESGGCCAVHAEGSIVETINDYLFEAYATRKSADDALAVALAPTRWEAGACADLGTASMRFYHTNVLAGLRDLEAAYGAVLETELSMDFSAGRVGGRRAWLADGAGTWRGARLTYGKNMERCVRTVLSDEVHTALYGYGAGLAAVDEDGNYTGGFRRKLTFSDVNGGVAWVGDDDARELWGRWNADRTEKVHSFGEVTFSSCTDANRLLTLTRQALESEGQPKVSYEVDAHELEGCEDVFLGDEVAVVDDSISPGRHIKAQVVGRRRTFAETVETSLTIGSVLPSLEGLIVGITGELAEIDIDAEAPATEDTTSYVLGLWLVLDADGAATLSYDYVAADALEVGQQAFEVDTAGYESDSARPWHDVRTSFASVAIDSSVATAALTDVSYWFAGMTSLAEVSGFEALSGVTAAAHLFNGCTSLETIYATSFENALSSSTAGSVLVSCWRLVGGAGDAFKNGNGYAKLKLGDGGLLTDPAADTRRWAWMTVYSDGALEVSAEDAAASGREALAHGRVCVDASYDGYVGMPWYGQQDSVTSAAVLDDMAGLTGAVLDNWFSHLSGLTGVEGLANLAAPTSMAKTLTGCTSLANVDLCGLDTSALRSVSYLFSGCTALTTIYADADFALPSSCTGTGCFFGCTKLVGGAGTTYSSSNYGKSYMRIDTADTPGYLTAKEA